VTFLPPIVGGIIQSISMLTDWIKTQQKHIYDRPHEDKSLKVLFLNALSVRSTLPNPRQPPLRGTRQNV
jgi:hypothetical protein